jgi:hypothetical protein
MNSTSSAMSALLIVAVLAAGGAHAEPAAAGVDPRDAAHAWRVHRGPYFESTWGIDIVGVKLVSSGWMLQFKYRVTDPEKAKGLLGDHAKPYLADEASGAKLAVPAMENVGELRQATVPEEGRTYFIIFGNANKIVRRGNRVSIEIGSFLADELIVE